jgi:hypothetical protein
MSGEARPTERPEQGHPGSKWARSLRKARLLGRVGAKKAMIKSKCGQAPVLTPQPRPQALPSALPAAGTHAFSLVPRQRANQQLLST